MEKPWFLLSKTLYLIAASTNFKEITEFLWQF